MPNFGRGMRICLTSDSQASIVWACVLNMRDGVDSGMGTYGNLSELRKNINHRAHERKRGMNESTRSGHKFARTFR